MAPLRLLAFAALCICAQAQVQPHPKAAKQGVGNRRGKDKQLQLVADIHDVMLAIVKRTLTTDTLPGHRSDCDVVLVYDELLAYPVDLASIWDGADRWRDKDIPLLLTINLQLRGGVKHANASSSAGAAHAPSRRLASYLHDLYRIQNCLVFMVWVTDPSILYPPDMNLHPGWREQDYVIVALHHISMPAAATPMARGHGNHNSATADTATVTQLTQHRFWKEVPNIVGLRLRNTFTSFVSVFTVLPYFNVNGSTHPLSRELDIWHVKTRSFQSRSESSGPKASSTATLPTRLFWDKFKNLHSSKLTVGISWKEPFFIMGDRENPYFDGLDWRLIRLVSQTLNFTQKWHLVSGTGRRRWSEETQAWTWTALMGEIERGTADFGVGGVSVSPRRLEDFGFCRSYWSDAYTFISPLNKSDMNAFQSLTKPMTLDVWLAIGAIGLLATCLMKAFATIGREICEREPKSRAETDTETNKQKQNVKDPRPVDIWFRSSRNNAYVLWSLFLQRSFRHVPKTNAVRCIYISTSFTFFILGIVFGGGLYAQLLEKLDDISVDQIRDMVRSGLKVYARDYDGHLNDYVTTHPRLNNLWQNHTTFVQANETWMTMSEVVMGHGIYVDSRAKLTFAGQYNYAGVNGFKFHMSSQNFLLVSVGWPTRKNWPLNRNIDNILIRVVESGIVQYWMSHFMRGKIGWDNEAFYAPRLSRPRENATRDVDPSVLDRNYDTLKMEQVYGIVQIWVVGLFLAALVLMFEVLGNCTAVSFKLGSEFCAYMLLFAKTCTFRRGGKKAATKRGKRTLKSAKKRLQGKKIESKRIFVRSHDQNAKNSQIIW